MGIRAMFQLPVYDFVKRMSASSGLDAAVDSGSAGTFMQRIGASMCSGLILGGILYPLDTFKRCSQLNGGIGYRQAFSDPFECTQYVFKESGGNMGLYRGCSTFIFSQVLIAFFQFSAFDAINASLCRTSTAKATE